MAISVVYKLFISLCLFVIYKLCVVDSYRYGLKSKTLHIPIQKLEDRLGERTRIIEADISKFQSQKDPSYIRHRRSTEKHTDNAPLSTVVCFYNC